MALSAEQFDKIRQLLKQNLIETKRFLWDEQTSKVYLQAKPRIQFDYRKAGDLPRIFQARVQGKDYSDRGVIFDSLSSTDKKTLEALKISYITLEGDLCLYLDTRVIKSAKTRPWQLDTRLAKTMNILIHSMQENKERIPLGSDLPSPTDFISPYGLEILDVLFRIDPLKLRTMTPYRICKDYSLNHSRLFRMQSSLGTKDLKSFYQAIRKLPSDWWRASFSYPRTNQRLRSFHKNMEHFVSMSAGEDETKIYSAMEELNKIYGEHTVMDGPDEQLKQIGLLSTSNTQLWVTGDDAYKKMKQMLRLVPAKSNPKASSLSLSLLKDSEDLHKQTILSKAPFEGRFHSSLSEYNLFRTVWDTFSLDSRSQEAGMDLLKMEIFR